MILLYLLLILASLLCLTKLLLWAFVPASKKYGSAKVLKWHKSMNRWNKGLEVAPRRRMTKTHSMQHACILASSGSGKSQQFTLPNCLRISDIGASLLLLDPKAEAYDLLAPTLVKKGYRIVTLNLDNIRKSTRYNPLAKLDSEQSVRLFAKTLFDMHNNDAKTEGIWANGTQQWIILVIQLLQQMQQPEHLNLANVIHLLGHISSSDPKCLTRLLVHQHGDERLWESFERMYRQDEKIMQGQLSGAKACMMFAESQDMQWLTAVDEFSFSIRDQKTAVFLITPIGRAQEYRSLISLFFGQLFDALIQEKVTKDTLPLYLLMDEFGMLHKVSQFAAVVSQIRFKGISMSIVLQSLEQLTAVYGKESDTILSNLRAFLVYGGMTSPLGMKRFEQLVGVGTHTETSTAGNTTGNARKPLDAFELRTMKPNECVLICNELPAIKMKTKPLWKRYYAQWKNWIWSKDGKLISRLNPIDTTESMITDVSLVRMLESKNRVALETTTEERTEEAEALEPLPVESLINPVTDEENPFAP